MRRYLFLSYFFLLSTSLSAQLLETGMSFHVDYNLYQWYRQPLSISQNNASSGQLLNVVPALGFGVWAGKINGLTLGLEGTLEYLPFSVDYQEYSGLGAVSFPVLLRLTQPFMPNEGISPFVGIGFGWQWNRNNLYARPRGTVLPLDPYFKTQVLELSVGIGAGWQKDQKQTLMMAFYSRLGTAAERAFSMNTGLRVKLLLNPKAKKQPPKFFPKERLYQVMQSNEAALFI